MRRRRSIGRTAGLAIVAACALVALAAPLVAPHRPDAEFHQFMYAPPMAIRLVDADGRWHAPFVHPWRLASRLEQRYTEDTTRRVPIAWFAHGQLLSSGDEERAPLLLLGGDSFGRDVFARLLYGARASLGVALAATIGALLIGVLVGGLAGYAGGLMDEALMRVSEFVLVLPTIYAVLALRAVMPLVLSGTTVFLLMTAIFALVGWPYVARGVRSIVAAERQREYAVAAVSLGAGHARLLFVHLLPACRGFLATQATLLLPAFILAEATLSFVGLGFPDPVPSWGAMLHEAANVSVIADFPWTLSPAAAIFLVVLALNLIVQEGRAVDARGSAPLA